MTVLDRLDGVAGGVQSRAFGVPDGQPHEDVDKQLQHWVFGLLGQSGVEFVVRRLPVLFGAQHRPQSLDARFVDLLRGPGCGQRFQQQPGVQQIADRDAQVFQVDDDRVGRRGGVRLADEQAAVRAAAHARHLMMLDESNRLAQHRSAHLEALLQCLLRAERHPGRPAPPDDVGLDAARDLGSSLVRPGLRGSSAVRCRASPLNCTPAQSDSACQQHASGDRPAAHRGDGDLRPTGHLPLPRLAAQLQAGFVQQPVAVHAPRRELAAVGVQRQGAVQRDPFGTLDERVRPRRRRRCPGLPARRR